MDRNTIKTILLKNFKDKKFSVLTLKNKHVGLYNIILQQTNYITNPKNNNERIYHILYDLYSIPKCKICGKLCSFININKGYQIYCSVQCSKKDPEIRKILKESNKKTYKEKKGEILQKYEDTCLKKFGVRDPNQLDEVKLRIKNTKDNISNIEEEALKKRKRTCLKKFGVDHYFQSDDFKEKFEIIKNENYNGKHPNCSETANKRRKETCLKNYGVDNIFKDPKFIEYNSKSSRELFIERLKKQLKILKFILLDDVYNHNRYDHKWECEVCNFIFIKKWRDMCRGYTCPKCYPRTNTSSSEKEIKELLISLGIKNIIENDRKIIYPKELDIFLPDYNVAIEFNGLFWHREDRLNDLLYHVNKTNLCNQKEIRLIHIFEDEWINKDKKEIVKHRLKQILHLSTSERIHARKCEIKYITSSSKNSFLNLYHLQGKDVSSINLGAFYNNELVSVMTFSKGSISKGSRVKKGTWELNRFCSNFKYHIPGIASKLLTYFKRNYKWNKIYSYADRRWSTGNLYYKLGFDLKYITKPNYWYLKNHERIHRFNLRKRADEPKDIPEWVLRQKEGYYRIWDCGNFKFEIENKNHIGGKVK